MRYAFDGTPVGHYKPFQIDCILGLGYDYTGIVDVTVSGFSCQKWNQDFPHQVKVRPADDDHNFCRFVVFNSPSINRLGQREWV